MPWQSYGSIGNRKYPDGSPRQHAGTDFDISGNEIFYSRIGGVVTYIGNDPGGYGNYVDIYNSKFNKTERIAEGRDVLVKMGETVAPGQPVARGETNTGVIHYEIRTGRKRTYGKQGSEDPVKFLRSLGQEVKEKYPDLASAMFDAPRGRFFPDTAYQLQEAPEVIPFDIAMVLNSETASGTLTQTGTGAIVLAAAENVPELDDATFMNVRQTIMTILAYNRK